VSGSGIIKIRLELPSREEAASVQQSSNDRRENVLDLKFNSGASNVVK
jgi:hypothetical protein